MRKKQNKLFLFIINPIKIYIFAPRKKIETLSFNNMFKSLHRYLFIFAGCSTPLWGQDTKTTKDTTVHTLSEVVVSATRTLRQLSSLPLQVQLVKEKEIRSINSSRLSDILAEQNGLVTIPGHGRAGREGLQMQGLGAEYTLILIDEMPLIGRFVGQIDLNRVSIGNIKQVEIVKGASSSLYGSEALAGVINIITQIPEDGLRANVGYKKSSFATHDASMNVGYRNKKWDISSFFNLYGSDGYSLSDPKTPTVPPYYNTTARTKVGYRFNDKTNLNISGRYFLQDQQLHSGNFKGVSNITEWNFHSKLNNRYNNKWSSYFEFYLTNYKTAEYIPNRPDIANRRFDQIFLRPEVRGKYSPKKNTDVIMGVGANLERAKNTIFISDPRMQSYYTYGQLDTYLTPKMNLIGGFRYDLHSEYTSQFSPKIALKYDFTDRISSKISVGYGYKAPDFEKLYYNFTNSNAGYSVLGYNAVITRLMEMEKNGEISTIYIDKDNFLKSKLAPESSLSFNFGIDLKPFSNLKLQMNLFRNDIKNLIETRMIALKKSGQGVYSFHNVEKVYTQGLEANVLYYPINNLSLSVGYQLLYAKNKTAERQFEEKKVYAKNASGEVFQLQTDDYFGLFNRSRHSANVKIFYQVPRWDADFNIRAIYRGKYGVVDTNSNKYLDSYDEFVEGYTMLNIAANKHFGERYSIGIGVNNALDYTNPKYISNISGRIMYASMNINF